MAKKYGKIIEPLPEGSTELMIPLDELDKHILEGKRDEYYDLRAKYTNQIQLHSDYRVNLIRELFKNKYPTEPENINAYRIENFTHATKTYFNKIVTTLAKINKADDFVIKHNNTYVRDYTEYEIPHYTSIREWFFTVGVKALLSEPNGMVAVIPYIDEEKERWFPYFRVIRNHRIITKQDDYVIIKEDDGNFTYFDRRVIAEIVMIDSKNTRLSGKRQYRVNILVVHNFGKIPAITLGGNPVDVENPEKCYESLISGVVPFWNQALIEFSDKNAGIKQHLFPEKWRYETDQCPTCKGNGTILFKEKKITCDTCSGTGNPPATGMFSEITIRPGSLTDPKFPIPPAGYLQKDFKAIEMLDVSSMDNIYNGLAAVNMEFLADIGANQSGRAKEMDRSEMNAFISQFTRHSIVNIIEPLYELSIMWLFFDTGEQISNSMYPDISIPSHFDFLTGDNYDARILTASNNGVDNYIISRLQRRYIIKTFGNFTDDMGYLLTINEMNPIPGKDSSEKIAMLEAGAVTYLDYIISNNIELIVRTLAAIDRRFFGLDYREKRTRIEAEAKKIINKIEKEKPKPETRINNIQNNLANNEEIVEIVDPYVTDDDDILM